MVVGKLSVGVPLQRKLRIGGKARLGHGCKQRVVTPCGVTEHAAIVNANATSIAGYLRLSLPAPQSPNLSAALPDLDGAALIREVHVYGQSLAVGAEQAGAAQHIGLGTRLLEQAAQIARAHGYQRLAVIAAIGTRLYYEARGFQRGDLYLVQPL